MPRWFFAILFCLFGNLARAEPSGPPADTHRPKKHRRHSAKKALPGTPSNDDSDDDDDGGLKPRRYQSIFFGGDQHRYGFELSGSTGITKLEDVNVRQMSGGFGILVDHDEFFGVSAAQFATPVKYKAAGDDVKAKLSYWELEYAGIGAWDFILNFRSGLRVGAGTLSLEQADTTVTRPVYVAEPMGGLYFNILPFLRFGLDVSYLMVAVDGQGIRGDSLSGLNYSVSLRGGAF